MATHVKNSVRFQPADWYTSNYSISTNAERQREASFQTRQEARFLSNETDSKTKWDQYDNNTRLADRVDDIRKWKEILEKCLADLDKEVGPLSQLIQMAIWLFYRQKYTITLDVDACYSYTWQTFL